MQALKISIRIAKFLGKVILSLLLVLVSAVAIIHIPPVQRQITRAVSNYLSSKIEAKVYIKRIEFSILGHIILEDLTVWNRDSIQIFSIGKIEINSSLFDLITGDFIIDEIRIVGLDGQLTQDKDGLNVQFILDAFQPSETSSTNQSKALKLQFKKVELEDIDLEFLSTQNGIQINNVVGMLTIQDAEYSTQPNSIKADKVSLQSAVINILATSHPEFTDAINTLKTDSIDFGSGISVKVMAVEIKDTDFSFHKNKVFNTPKFNPSHINLKDIEISLSDILVGMRKDTVAAILNSLSVQLPGFKVDDARASLQWSHNRLVASGLHLTSNTNSLDADFKGEYDLQFLNDTDHASAEINASGRINPDDFSYFFSDSIMKYFSQWESTDLTLEGHYTIGKGDIKTLNLKTANSQLHVSGVVGDVLNFEKIYWNDLAINASIGSDFKRTLAPFLRNIKLPPDATLQLKSSGNKKKASVDGDVFSNWGDVKVNGIAGLQADNIKIDLDLIGEQVDLGQWVNVSWIGALNLSLDANGLLGKDTNIEIIGLIKDIEMMDEPIRNIDFQSSVKKSSAVVTFSINDPKYQSAVHSEISFVGPLQFTTTFQLQDFKLGTLLKGDSTLSVSGNIKSNLVLDQSTVKGYMESDSVLIQNQSTQYVLDTLAFHAMLSPDGSAFDYYSDDVKGKLTSNFDIRNSPEVIQVRLLQVLKRLEDTIHPNGTRALKFMVELENATLLQLLGIQIDDFSAIKITGELDEQKQTTVLHATSGKFKGYGISLDTLNTNLIVLHDSVSATLRVKNLIYNSVELGHLDFDLLTKGDTAVSNLHLSNDSTSIFGLRTRILPTDSGTFIYPDNLNVINHDYIVDPKNPVYINTENVVLNHFQISRENMHINLNGDLNTFDVSLQNVDLSSFNFLLSADTTVIHKGNLTGTIAYSPHNNQLNLKANIDSLSLYNSNPLTIAATAVGDGDQIPFDFLVTNTSNTIDLKGQYILANAEVDATLLMNINNPEIFTFLVSGFVDEMSGTIKGKTAISGPIQKPALQGHVQFKDVEFTTVNPKITFKVEDDSIMLDNSSLLFNDFTLYDHDHHPLQVNGNVTTKDFQSLSYDLHLTAEDYTLMNKPDSASGTLNGVLVIDSDLKLKGNEKDTNVEARVTIKNNTHLTFVSSSEDIELLKAEGIVDFIDPTLALDSALQQSSNFYDSLIASLPDFNLNSTIKIEEDAKLRIVIDGQSGDYMETSGRAALELGYDRTGNLHLVGDYTIKQGVYRLSFYDLVKRNFTLVPNSSIHWSGSPENGDLNIKAVHTVQSNSIGLIGHEIGENEKSIYKRSLDYEVGINISGTLDKPVVSFSLDLPQEEKTNYPVLANKLDRLRQPEFQSELNKQVFGLLVLGGFLPETSGSDINSSQIATTALSNSVNSLLASQLNRFASQYIKGVNIDVGIQSYSDYSAPGGKTQTAMDFRVSKRIMNDRLSFEVGGDFDINQDQSGANTGTKNYRGDIAIIYDLTGNGDKQLKLFNNETYDIVYQEIRNTGISLIFIREFSKDDKKKRKKK